MSANSQINGRISLTRGPQPKGGPNRTRTLKTIFGWVTEKELIRYTRDLDREVLGSLDARHWAERPAEGREIVC
jgi:hypothetical protein